jgi:DNA-binding transcriptional ArsR family regulator
MDAAKVKKLDDPRTLRALAHPLRLRLLGALRSDGPATVTTLASEVDEAIPLVSYHLRQLADHGFIEQAPDLAKDRRETWWRSSHDFTSWSVTDFLDTPERLDAVGVLQREILRRHVARIEQFLEHTQNWDEEWLTASEMSDVRIKLTPSELTAMKADLWEVIERWREREPSPGAGPADLILYAFPGGQGSA